MENNRLGWIDYSKSICIFLIVVGHVPNTPPFLCSFLWTFHVPIFFFISGYLYKENVAPKVFIIKKVKRILLPYIYLYLLSVVFLVITKADYNFSNIYKMSIGFLWGTNVYPYYANVPLWFLISLFSVELIFNFIVVRYPLLFVFFLITSVEFYSKGLINLFFSFDLTLIGLNYFIIGFLLRKYNLLSKIKNSLPLLITAFITCTVLTSIYAYNGNVWYGGRYYLISLSGGVIGICMIISISKILEKLFALHSIIVFYSNRTILILGLHSLLNSIVYNNILPIFAISSAALNSIVESIIIILILTPIIYLISKYIPEIEGNLRKKTSQKII